MINILDLLPRNEEVQKDPKDPSLDDQNESDSSKKERELIMARPMGFRSTKMFRFDLPDTPAVVNYTTACQTIKSASFEKIIEKITSKSVCM